MKVLKFFFIGSICMLVTSCVVHDPIEAFKLSATNLKDRQIQTRVYRQVKEESILAASAAVFQDMGYTLAESETRLGVITATKEADATDGGQVFLSVLAAFLGGGATPIDDKQEFTATLVVLPRGNNTVFSVRMTMQRIVWDTRGNISKLEAVNSESVYKDFFDKLSKAVFLEKNI